MSHTPEPPLPQLDDANRFFWTSGADGLLRVLRCQTCRYWLHPPAPICPQCLGDQLKPEAVSGLATVEAVTINYQQWTPGMKVPFVVAIVELDEQKSLRLTTNIVGVPVDAVHIGQRVRVDFEHREDVWLPLFTPA
jgi:uncharacterized OB-fold protein